MKTKTRRATEDMRAEYEFDYRTGVRGKYVQRMVKEGWSLVLLDPDVAKAFRTSAEVNQGLRTLLDVSAATRGFGARKKSTRRTAAARR